MREGVHIIYVIQFKSRTMADWSSGTDAAHILFDDLSYEDARGETGGHYRELIAPEHECWQQTGRRGYLRERDATVTMIACNRAKPEYEYRLVRQFLVQHTEEVG